MGGHIVRPVLVAGRYRLLEPVGSGGMGRVWLARDEMLHRDVAIKEVVPPDWLSDAESDELRDRTLREARAAARLNHANVVKIYDVVHTEAWPWIVMEYVPSRSLQHLIRQDGPLPPRRVAEIGLAVLAALQAAHRAGVLHRDVKPHNVLIGESGRVVLTDFGLATFEDDGTTTRAGLVMGSPQYVAPERAASGISTVQTDLWSLGATLFAAVEGHSPFARPNTMATLTALATEPPDPARRAGPLTPVLTGLLRKDPRQRLTAAEVERRLRRVTHGGTGAPPWGLPRVNVLILATAAALVTVIVVGLALLALDRPAGDHTSPGPTPSGAASTGAPTARTAAAPLPGVRACDTPPAGPRMLTPRPGAATVLDGRALPPHWSWHRDDAGFRLAVPDGWTYFRAGDIVCFVDPGGSRTLGIVPRQPATTDPVADARTQERRLLAAGVLPGYRRIRVQRTLFVAGAEWEFTFDNNGRRHVEVRTYPPSAGHAAALFWVTRDFDWAFNTGLYDLITPSFKAGG
ncbi:MAG TPA: serine/threonine-protein kinase [Micromonosporaceae bacterium]|jgi:tRNA A-37 threonylcarbamoyl transferase component Bud32